MVVVASKVGQYSIDRSPKVFVGHLASFNLAVERFDFPACPLDSITVAAHDNSAGLGQSKLGLTVFERLCQRDDFRLRNAHRQLQTGSLGDNKRHDFLRVNARRDNDVIVVHVVTGALHAELAFDVIVQRRREGYHLGLTWLNAERQTLLARNRIYHIVAYLPDVGV